MESKKILAQLNFVCLEACPCSEGVDLGPLLLPGCAVLGALDIVTLTSRGLHPILKRVFGENMILWHSLYI